MFGWFIGRNKGFQPNTLPDLQLWLDANRIGVQGYSLNMTTGHVSLAVQSVGGVDLFADSDTFSVETYVRFTGTANGVVLSKSAAAQNLRTFEFFRFANDFYTTIRGATTLVRAAANITNDVWYHIALTWDGTTAKFYWNGLEVATPTVGSAAIENVNIGFGTRNVASPSAGFNGQLSDCRIWNTARTAQQIADNYQKRLIGNESGLVGYWKLDKGSGTTVEDSTSNANAGTITGAIWDNSEPLTEPISDNTAVRVWADQSGKGYNAEQSTTAARPTYRTNQLNGLPAVVFDGTDDRLTIPSSTATFKFLHSDVSTVFIVARAGSVADPNAIYILLSTGNSNTNIVSYEIWWDDRVSAGRNNSIRHFINAGLNNNVVGSIVDNVVIANTFNILSVTSQPANVTASERSAIQVNAGTIRKTNLQTGTLSTANANNNLTIGNVEVTGIPLNGAMCEIIVYNRALNTSELSQVHRYLSRKWGIQLA